MNIAVDLSPLQGPHRMRGIGSTITNFIESISAEDKRRHHFVFYTLSEDDCGIDPISSLNVTGIDYETRELRSKPTIPELSLPGRLSFVNVLLKQVSDYIDLYFGDSRVHSLDDIDVFLQLDQSQCLPKKRRGASLAIVAYDLIPYILEWDYLWSYKTARYKGKSRKGAVVRAGRRFSYIHKLRVNLKRADKVVSISDSTRSDILKHTNVRTRKVKTIPLGVRSDGLNATPDKPQLHKYVGTSWGYVKRDFDMDPSENFLLCIGGADYRRRIPDLVTAYNMLRARGNDIKLVFVGDTLQGPKNIPIEETQRALLSSSYGDDIIYMGYVDDATREWLYKNTLAVVFPSVYEGFGLPVLEAMKYGTQVISYNNAATVEVAGSLPIYANDPMGIMHGVESLAKRGSKASKERMITHAQKFTWSKTSTHMLRYITGGR